MLCGCIVSFLGNRDVDVVVRIIKRGESLTINYPFDPARSMRPPDNQYHMSNFHHNVRICKSLNDQKLMNRQ